MTHLNYVTDIAGNQIAVLIPINEWLAFQKEYEETKRKLEILQGIQSALQEVHQARKENRKLQSLTDFLNECWSGGFRIITYLVESIEAENGDPFIVVTLLSIYDKSEISTLSEAQISSLVAHYLLQQPRLDE